MADKISERVSVLESQTRQHNSLEIHPLGGAMLRELNSQVIDIREQNAARDARDEFIKEQILELKVGQEKIRHIIENGLAVKIAQAISDIHGVKEEIVTAKQDRAAAQKDLKTVLFPIITHAVEMGVGAVVLLVVARVLGVK